MDEIIVNITNNQKLKIANVRVNGDILDSDGNTITEGAGIELDAAQVATLGVQAIQTLADTWCAQQTAAEGEGE